MKNTGLENAGLENVEPNRRGGKDGTGKHGTKAHGWKSQDWKNTGPNFQGWNRRDCMENEGIPCAWVAKRNVMNVRGHVRVNVTAGRGDPRTLQEATQSGN